MLKILKWIGIVLIVVIILIICILFYIPTIPSVPSDYIEKVKIENGEIESTYLKKGSYETKKLTIKTEDPIKEYSIYYPKKVVENKKLPLILSLNGTGIPASKYPAWFEHMASYGFLVVGTEDPSTGKGESADTTLNYLENELKNVDSSLYHLIDFENIGLVGHSQGGAGVLSAVTIGKNRSRYKTIIALSPTNEETAHGLGWLYDLTKINVPTLMLAGTVSDFETKIVIPIEKMNNMFHKISSPKVMARRKEADHGQMLYAADGYVTAWFMWQLQGDERAGKAFIGGSPELLTNTLYQDQQIRIE